MAPAIPAPARDTAQEAGLSQSFWQQAAELGALDEQHRLAAIEPQPRAIAMFAEGN